MIKRKSIVHNIISSQIKSTNKAIRRKEKSRQTTSFTLKPKKDFKC